MIDLIKERLRRYPEFPSNWPEDLQSSQMAAKRG
jgi:hypothetical protein